MYETLKPDLIAELDAIKQAGLYKSERIITTPQGALIKTGDGPVVLDRKSVV